MGKFLERPVVDFFLRKPGIFDIVRLRSSRYGSSVDPIMDHGFFGWCEFRLALGHFILGNALPQEACIGTSRHDGWPLIASSFHESDQP